MRRCKEALEAERAIRALDFSPDESRLLRAFQFMTAKPMVIVLNLNEGRMSEAAEWEARARARVAAPATTVVACCARNEMEIARIDDPAERREFMESFEIAEPAADRIIRETYATLGLITFFTAGPKEVHAWTLRKGESIVRAAGTIHSDLERGFISAEVIDVADLVAIGAMAEAKKRGKVRLEGKGYETRDGDVIEVRFSV
jgi:hypothetical protein